MRSSTLLLLSVIGLTGCVERSVPPGDEVDSYILESMKAQKVPAISVVVIKDGKVLKQKAYGKASLDPPVPATESTIFPLFSITKPFTAVGVLRLVDQGKLGLDDTLGKLLPDQPESWRPITVRQLLSHTSGLPDLLDSSDDVKYLSENGDAALRTAAANPLLSKPGDSYLYLQTGYVLLGKIIQKITGKRFAQYMKEDVFLPLGMTSTTFANRRTKVPGRAIQYQNVKFEEVNGTWQSRKLDAPTLSDIIDNPDYNDVGATLNTNTDDLIKWERALDTGKLLKPETIAAMWTPSTASIRTAIDRTYGMGLGWATSDKSGHRNAYHNGGGSSFYNRFLDDHLTIIVLTNCHGAETDQLVDWLASHYDPAIAERH